MVILETPFSVNELRDRVNHVEYSPAPTARVRLIDAFQNTVVEDIKVPIGSSYLLPTTIDNIPAQANICPELKFDSFTHTQEECNNIQEALDIGILRKPADGKTYLMLDVDAAASAVPINFIFGSLSDGGSLEIEFQDGDHIFMHGPNDPQNQLDPYSWVSTPFNFKTGKGWISLDYKPGPGPSNENGWLFKTYSWDDKHKKCVKALFFGNGMVSLDGGELFTDDFPTTMLTLTKDITYMEANAVSSKTLEGLVVPKSLTFKENNNGEYFGMNSSKFTTAVFPDTSVVPNGALMSNTAMTYCVIPAAGFQNSGNPSFAWCTNLKEIVVRSGVKTIPYGTFDGCGLEKVHLPKTLKEIEMTAFSNCVAIKEIIVDAVIPPSASDDCFDGIPSTVVIRVPPESVEAYKTAEGWSPFANCIVPIKKPQASIIEYLPLKGGTMSGDIDMGMKSIKNVGLPVSDTDAANKKYVDDRIGGGTGARDKKYIDLGEAHYSDVDINISEYDVFSIEPVGRIAPKIIVRSTETRVVIEWILIVKNCNGSIVEWENNILWEGGVAPELTTSDIIEFFSYDKGTTWYASKKTDFLNVYDGVWSYQLSNNKAVLKYLGNGTQKIVVPDSVNGYKTAVNGNTFYGINDYVVDVSAIDFSDITSGYGFFTEYWGDGFAATAKEIIGIKMPNVTDFGRAFSGNGYLVNANTIIVGDKLVEVQRMYDSCPKLTVGVTINTSKVSNFHQMYAGCTALTTVPVLNTAKGTVMRNMFDGCKSLPTTFPWSIDLTSMTPALASGSNGVRSMFAGSSVKTVRFKNVQAGTAQYLTAAVLGTQLTNIIIENKI